MMTNSTEPVADAASGADGGAESANDIVKKDMAESPASETETAQKQNTDLADTVDGDIDRDAVKTAPGTGGPDDAGDIEVDPEDLNMPGHGSD